MFYIIMIMPFNNIHSNLELFFAVPFLPNYKRKQFSIVVNTTILVFNSY